MLLTRVRLLLAVLGLGLIAAPAAEAAGFHVTVRRGSHGVPHIVAKDWASLGYGYAFAFARDDICQIADSYVTVRAQRSRFFGPDKTWTFSGNGTVNHNLASDFLFAHINQQHTVEKLRDQAPPNGPRPEVTQLVRGYVAGYNAYLKSVGGAKGITDPTCRGKDWVTPIEEMDVYRRFYELALLASSGVAIDGIGGAAPAAGGADARSLLTPGALNRIGEGLDAGGIGSNAIALGRAGTRNGHGMVLGNPHFPWEGAERFYESHLEIPGKIDVEGASLFGVPLVLIGHTPSLAWSHTVSTARRFTIFELKLVPGSPTTYLYDGAPKAMQADRVTVDVRQADGSVKPQSRTMYSSVQGPIFTSLLGLPLFPWTPATAYALGDANAANFRYLNHFFEIDRAKDTHEVLDILKRNQGIPWVNTIAADDNGQAFYADISTTPNVPDSHALQCAGSIGAATFESLRIPTLDGSRSSCGWLNDPDAIQPGTFGPSHMPHLFREDYVENSNDSYWLSNPQQPLEGYSLIIGDERAPRALRTRLGLRIIQQRLDGSDGRPGKGFSLDDLTWAVFNDRQYAGELLRDELVGLCERQPMLLSSSGTLVDASGACPVLRAWDLHDDLDSKGAVLFRRFADHALNGPGGVGSTIGLVNNALASYAVGPFSTPFSASDPVNTPRGLDTLKPTVGAALADAVSDLQSSNMALDITLRETQTEPRGDEKVPVPGGPGGLGVFNVITDAWVPGKGFPNVVHGSSFVMAVSFNGTPCPDARSILTYSQSVDRTSPYYADQTHMFTDKRWKPMRFCEREVLADPALTVEELGGRCRVAIDPTGAKLTAGALGVPSVTLRGRRGSVVIARTGRCGAVRRLEVRGRALRWRTSGRATAELRRGGRVVRRIALRGARGRATLPRGRYDLRVVSGARRIEVARLR